MDTLIHQARVWAAMPWLGWSALLGAAMVAASSVGQRIAGVA